MSRLPAELEAFARVSLEDLPIMLSALGFEAVAGGRWHRTIAAWDGSPWLISVAGLELRVYRDGEQPGAAGPLPAELWYTCFERRRRSGAMAITAARDVLEILGALTRAAR